VPRNGDELLAIGPQQLQELFQQGVAIGMPPRPVGCVEGATCGGDGLTHVLRRCIGRLGDHLSGPRTDVVVRPSAGGLAQLAVDIELAV